MCPGLQWELESPHHTEAERQVVLLQGHFSCCICPVGKQDSPIVMNCKTSFQITEFDLKTDLESLEGKEN